MVTGSPGTDSSTYRAVNSSGLLDVPEPLGLLSGLSDPDGPTDALLLTEPDQGRLAPNLDGSFVCAPPPEFSGTVAVSFVCLEPRGL